MVRGPDDVFDPDGADPDALDPDAAEVDVRGVEARAVVDFGVAVFGVVVFGVGALLAWTFFVGAFASGVVSGVVAPSRGAGAAVCSEGTDGPRPSSF